MKEKNYVIMKSSDNDDYVEVFAMTKDLKKGESYILEKNTLISKVNKLYLDFLNNEYVLWKKDNPLPPMKDNYIELYKEYNKKHQEFMQVWLEKLDEKERDIFNQGLINMTFFIHEVEEL